MNFSREIEKIKNRGKVHAGTHLIPVKDKDINGAEVDAHSSRKKMAW